MRAAEWTKMILIGNMYAAAQAQRNERKLMRLRITILPMQGATQQQPTRTSRASQP